MFDSSLGALDSTTYSVAHYDKSFYPIVFQLVLSGSVYWIVG